MVLKERIYILLQYQHSFDSFSKSDDIENGDGWSGGDVCASHVFQWGVAELMFVRRFLRPTINNFTELAIQVVS